MHGEPEFSDLLQVLIPDPPGFIRKGRAGCGFENFDFWATEPTGHAATDAATGRRYFFDAVSFAHEVGSISLLSLVLGSMRGRGVLGPMESGFLDALAAKAAVSQPLALDLGADPDAIAGNDLANIFIGLNDAKAVRWEIGELFCENEHASRAALHTFCRAALLGGRH